MRGKHDSDRAGRPVGLTQDAGYQIGVRLTLPVSPEQAWDFLTGREGLQVWLGGLEKLPAAAGQPYATREEGEGELRVLKPREQLRLSWRRKEWPAASIVQIRLLPAKRGTTVSFHQERLDGPLRREEMKRHWDRVLDLMQERLTAE